MAGVLSVLLIALLTNISTKLLVWTKRNLQTQTGLTVTSVPQMALATFGTRGLRFASFVLMTTQLGTTVAYNIFLGVSLTAIVEDLFPAMHHGIGFSYESYHPYVFFIMCQVMLFSVMVQMNDVASMTPLLMFAQFAMTCAMVLIITNGMVNPSVCDRDGATGIPTILAIEHSMAEPARFEEMFDRAQTLIVLVLIIFGTMEIAFSGANGSKVADRTLNVPGTWGDELVKMFMVVVIFLSYPLQFIPIAEILHAFTQQTFVDRIFKGTPQLFHSTGMMGPTKADFRVRLWVFLKTPQIWGVFKGMPQQLHSTGAEIQGHAAVAAAFDGDVMGPTKADFRVRLWVFLKIVACGVAGVIAVLMPHFGHVLSIVGSVSFSMVTFMFPPLMYLRSRQGSHTAQMVILCCLIVLFGCLVTTVGLWSNFTTASVWKAKIEK
ncbi:transmembrane amino acid transporter protein-domain-containing protein, partial [Baffinella frigidus]